MTISDSPKLDVIQTGELNDVERGHDGMEDTEPIGGEYDDSLARVDTSKVRNWAERHVDAVNAIVKDILNPETKGVYVEGGAHSGKTTLALAAAMDERLKHLGIKFFFTSAQVQQTPFAIPQIEQRTGLQFNKLPKTTEKKGKKVVVIDEISQRRPDSATWPEYLLEDPNTVVIMLGHPNSQYKDEWQGKFLQKGKVIEYHLAPGAAKV